MLHYKTFFDPGEFLECADLAGRDVVVEIESVSQGTLGRGGKESKKPVIKMTGKKKKFALNKTNGKIIASLYGPDVSLWKGKLLTLYGTTTQFGGETVECIRVRPVAPSGKRTPPTAADKVADAATDAEAEQSTEPQ